MTGGAACGMQVGFIVEYIDFLSSLTEDHNTRALFEKVSSSPTRHFESSPTPR